MSQYVAAPLSLLQRCVSYIAATPIVCMELCIVMCCSAAISATVSSSWCAKRQIDVCGGAYSYVWHDLFKCVAWLVYISDVTHSYV